MQQKPWQAEWNKKNIERRREWNREWIKNNRAKYNASKAKYRVNLKLRVMRLYSDPVACVTCGFNNLDGLVLDHINDDGAQQRKALGVAHRGYDGPQYGTRIYEYINKFGRLDGLQVLYANCNTIKHIRKMRRDRIGDPELLENVEALVGNYTA